MDNTKPTSQSLWKWPIGQRFQDPKIGVLTIENRWTKLKKPRREIPFYTLKDENGGKHLMGEKSINLMLHAGMLLEL